jgi:hypothetical protein
MMVGLMPVSRQLMSRRASASDQLQIAKPCPFSRPNRVLPTVQTNDASLNPSIRTVLDRLHHLREKLKRNGCK